MKKIEFEDIEKALQILDLQEDATLNDIKKAYYRLARHYHPDKCKGEKKALCEERFKEISRAYRVLYDYCTAYGCELSKQGIKKNLMGADYYDHVKRFYDGWLGDLDLA